MSIVRPLTARRAFSLIELLVVIAVIAILAALLFPVFASVREKARQATAISNMHQLQVGLGAYQLDYHKYPDVLFGYADGGGAMADYKPATGALPTLYPNYVKDYHAFLDPNNQADPAKTADVTGALAVNSLTDGTNALNTQKTHTFYKADAYDISPQVTGTNTVNAGIFVPRYQLNWTSLSPATQTSVGAFYQKQLRWKTIPGDTYVTCTTYHVQNADKVIVLYESGATKVMDSSQFLKPGPDVAALSASGDVSNAKFWQVQQ